MLEKKSKMFQQDNEMLSSEVVNMKSIIEELSSERDCLREKLDKSDHTHRRRIEVRKWFNRIVNLESHLCWTVN